MQGLFKVIQSDEYLPFLSKPILISFVLCAHYTNKILNKIKHTKDMGTEHKFLIYFALSWVTVQPFPGKVECQKKGPD
jgi:hypothetical protein